MLLVLVSFQVKESIKILNASLVQNQCLSKESTISVLNLVPVCQGESKSYMG